MLTPQAAYMRRKRAEWKERGLCKWDGKETGGRSRCPGCLERHRLYMRRRRAAKNIEEKQA